MMFLSVKHLLATVLQSHLSSVSPSLLDILWPWWKQWSLVTTPWQRLRNVEILDGQCYSPATVTAPKSINILEEQKLWGTEVDLWVCWALNGDGSTSACCRWSNHTWVWPQGLCSQMNPLQQFDLVIHFLYQECVMTVSLVYNIHT